MNSTKRCPLRLLSENVDLVIDACDGERTFKQSPDVFTGYIQVQITSYDWDISSPPTPPTLVNVHEIVENNPEIVFSSINPNVECLAFTQAQIISFCGKYRDWLHGNNNQNFFMVYCPSRWSPKDLYVTDVRIQERGLTIYGPTWYPRHFLQIVADAKYRPRVIVPLL